MGIKEDGLSVLMRATSYSFYPIFAICFALMIAGTGRDFGPMRVAELAARERCLKRLRERNDLPFVGLIGSKTKWASFSHRLLERGFTQDEIDRITCPIGLPGIKGKEPEVIAASVAAQLLQTLG